MPAKRRCQTCGAEVDGPETHECSSAVTVPAEGSAVRVAQESAETPTAGRVLAGRYLVLREVGQGGSGTVFRARDQELDVDVAVKVLPSGDPPTVLTKRFRREIRITRDIDHENVARVFDIGESDGLTFLTMRWIDGEPLSARVRQDGPLAEEPLRRLAKGLVAALAAAHRLGVVHRDVKPANVLVSEAGEPVLIDFGIATDRGDSPAAQVRRGERITLDGHMPGTMAFMSPEQMRGEDTPPATDLYALALTLAFAATGEARRPDLPERVFAPLGATLRRLLVQCLEPDPSARPADAVALQEAVVAARRRRLVIRIGAATVLLVLVAVAAVVFAARRAEESALSRAPPPVVVHEIENRTDDPSVDWLEQGVRELLVEGLEVSGGVRIAVTEAEHAKAAHVGGRVVRDGDSVALDLWLRDSDDARIARSRVAHATGNGLFRGVDAAVASFVGKLGVRGGHVAPDERRARGRPGPPTDDVVAFAHFAKAQAEIRSHDYRPALEELRRATVRDPGFALAHLQRFVLVSTGEHGPRAEADAALESARTNRDRLPPSQRELLDAIVEARTKGAAAGRVDRLRAYLRSHTPEAAAYWMATEIERDDPEVRREILVEWASRIPDDPEPHNQLGYLLLAAGDERGAEREFREYLRLAPDEPNAHDSYGDFLRERGRFTEALREYDRALALDPGFSSAAVDAVDTALRANDLDAAESRLAMARAASPPTSRDFRQSVREYAAIPLLGGDLAGALDRLREVAGDGSLGSRRYEAHAYEAIVRALGGETTKAHRAAAEADRLHRLYHGSDGGLPALAPYVDGLAAYRRRDAAALAAAAEALPPTSGTVRAPAPAAPAETGCAEVRRTLLAGLARVLAGDPSGAAERLLAPNTYCEYGAPFLVALERARALSQAGRPDEAAEAYADAIARRQRYAATPEAAHEWRGCLREAASLARERGRVDRAAALEDDLARLVLTPRPSRR